MGPADSRRISRVPRYSGFHYAFAPLRIRSSHALWLYFPEHSARGVSCDGVVLQPHACRNKHGLGYSPFARHYWGNHLLFSFPAGTKMFSVPCVSLRRSPDNIPSGYWVVPIRKSAGQGSFAPNRGLSQLITSFVAPGAKASTRCPYLLFCRLTVTCVTVSYFQLFRLPIRYCFLCNMS